MPSEQRVPRGQTRHCICSRCKKIMKPSIDRMLFECPQCRRTMNREDFIYRAQVKGRVIRVAPNNQAIPVSRDYSRGLGMEGYESLVDYYRVSTNSSNNTILTGTLLAGSNNPNYFEQFYRTEEWVDWEHGLPNRGETTNASSG